MSSTGQYGFVGLLTPTTLAIYTTIAMGMVRVSWSTHSDAPQSDVDAWDSALEISVYALEGELNLSGWGGTDPDLPNLAEGAEGWYRVRVFTRGRGRREDWDAGVDLGEVAHERYRLEVWPAPEAPPVMVKGSVDAGPGWIG